MKRNKANVLLNILKLASRKQAGQLLLICVSSIHPNLNAQESKTEEGEEIFVMDPFTVSTEANSGYTATTAVTASKIGALIKNTPLNVQVLTSEFIEDTGMTQFSDITKYSSSFSGDSVNASNFNSTLNQGVRGGSLSGGQGSTGGGRIGLNLMNGIRLRGFPISNVLRNGLPRAGNHSLKAVDRVEVVKGPVAIFFGQSTPGGAINYVTKRPLPNRSLRISTQVGEFDYVSWNFDYNEPLSESLGVRMFASRTDREGWRQFEKFKEDYFGGVIKWNTIESLTVVVEVEYISQSTNSAGSPVVTNPLYHNDFFDPPDKLLYLSQDSSFGRNTWNRGRGYEDTLMRWQNAIREDRDRWMRAREAAFPEAGFPATVTQYGLGGVEAFDQNKEIYDNAVADVFGPDANLGGKDSFTDTVSKVAYYEVSYRPFDWLAMKAMGNYGNQERQFMLLPANMPYADLTFAGTRNQVGMTENEFTSHLFDIVLSFDFLGMSHKLITGAERRKSINDRWRMDRAWPADLSNLYRYWNPVTTEHPPLQTVYPLEPTPAPTEDDPGAVQPGIFDEPHPVFGIISSRTVRTGAYFMHQGTAFNGRLHTMAGVRHENQRNYSNLVPTGTGSSDFLLDGVVSGTSMSVGAVFEITDNVNVYSSWNQNYKPNTGWTVRAGDSGDLNAADLAERSFLEDETGTGIDFGFKFDVYENKFSGQISLFQVEREGIARLNFERSMQRMLDEGWIDDDFRVQYWSNGGLERSQGMEIELLANPIPGWQMVFGYTHYFEANVINDPSLADFQAEKVVGNGLPNVSKDRLTIWNNYRFTDGFMDGFSMGAGLRYGSRSRPLVYDWQNDILNEAYTVFDIRFGYSWEAFGGGINLALNIRNITDELYSEGGIGYSAPRTWMVTCRFNY